MSKPITVRKACRIQMPLDGADAQALEHALTITERERDEAYDELNKQPIRTLFNEKVWNAAKKRAIDSDTGSGTLPGGGPHEDPSRTAYVVGLEKRVDEMSKLLYSYYEKGWI